MASASNYLHQDKKASTIINFSFRFSSISCLDPTSNPQISACNPVDNGPREGLDKFLKAASSEPETVLHYEFMQDYKSDDVPAAPTGVALSSFHKIMRFNVFDEKTVEAKHMINAAVTAITGCRLEN